MIDARELGYIEGRRRTLLNILSHTCGELRSISFGMKASEAIEVEMREARLLARA